MKQRLQKILSARGVASRRAAEEMIAQGRVCVNGIVATVGSTADPDSDEIKVDGILIPPQADYVYIMLNKPRGYVTTLHDEKGRKNAAQLVADCNIRVYPVGRLDMDSEGLLLFTNDGAFANSLMHPKHEVEKIYDTDVTGFSTDALEMLKIPIELDGYRIRPPKVELIGVKDNCARLRITIHEGRNRQVRRMCAAAGMTVARLRRIREGAVELGTLPCGKWRYLTQNEIRLLKE